MVAVNPSNIQEQKCFISTNKFREQNNLNLTKTFLTSLLKVRNILQFKTKERVLFMTATFRSDYFPTYSGRKKRETSLTYQE